MVQENAVFLIIVMAVCGMAPGAASAQSAPFATYDAASEPVLADPHDLTIGPDGRLYIADKFAHRITIMDPESLKIVGSFGEGELSQPRDIDFDASGRAIVADSGNSRVAIFNLSGGQAKLVGSLSASRTEGAVAHPNGRIYATSSGLGAIMALEKGKPVVSAFGLSGAHDVEVDAQGDLWVADMGNRRVVQFTPDLKIRNIFDDPKYGWVGPRYLAIDPAGRIVVADQDAHRMVMFNRDGALLGVIGDGLPGEGINKFDDPEGAAVSGSTYFFSDSDNNRVVRYQVVLN